MNDKLNTDDTNRVFKLTIAVLVASVGVFGVFGLLITHRVVGPVFVLQRHFKTLVDGSYPHVRPLRAGDEFGEAFGLFRGVVEMLRKRDEDELTKLKALVDAARAKGLGDDQVAALQALVDERAGRLAPRT